MKVEFHSGVADKLEHACRLLRKTQAAGAQVVVAGEPALLDRLDTALWTFDALSFLPHVRLRAGVAPAVLHQRTPVWLADDPRECMSRTVLVNLGADVPPGWDGFERVIDVVDTSVEDSAQGRRRWRLYGARAGVERVHHARGAAA